MKVNLKIKHSNMSCNIIDKLMFFIKLLKVQSLGGTCLIENPKLYTKPIGLAKAVISIFGFCVVFSTKLHIYY